ncbi:MAG TPA: hypothetical protein VF989_05960 [Polyangiaceae bacterium]
MTINPTTASTGASNPALDTSAGFGNTRSLTTGDMYEYVATLLGDIDSQMLLFKEQAETKVERADEEREFQALLRSLTDKDGKITIAPGSAEMAAVATLLEKVESEALRSALQGLLGSNRTSHGGPPAMPDTAGVVPATPRAPTLGAGDPRGTPSRLPELLASGAVTIDENAVSELLADSNNRLSSLSGENELTMMELNGLMQRRSQIIMFSSQTLAQLDQTAKTVIQNMRA